MKYSEAKQYLKEGMQIRVLGSDFLPCDHIGQVLVVIKAEGYSYVGEKYSRHYLENITELEILTNPDGSKWVHPDQKFKVGDRVRGIAGDIEGSEGIIESIEGSTYGIRIAKLGDKTWYTSGYNHRPPEEWKIGGLVRRPNCPWNNCLEKIEEPERKSVLLSGRRAGKNYFHELFAKPECMRLAQ